MFVPCSSLALRQASWVSETMKDRVKRRRTGRTRTDRKMDNYSARVALQRKQLSFTEQASERQCSVNIVDFFSHFSTLPHYVLLPQSKMPFRCT